jgi:hypothetical protein
MVLAVSIGMRLLLAFLLLSQSVLAESIPVDLYAALNPNISTDVERAAHAIIIQFKNEDLMGLLPDYLLQEHPSISKAIAAEVFVQLTERDQGDRGLIELTKKRSKELVRRATLQIVERLSKIHFRNLPAAFTSLSINEKKRLIDLMLDEGVGRKDLQIVNAASKLTDLSDSILILTANPISGARKTLAAKVLAKVAEDREGESGLSRLALRTDVDTAFSAAALSRIEELLSGLTGSLTKLKILDDEKKNLLVHQILARTSETSRSVVASFLVHLDQDGDLENILRSYHASSAGLRAAAECLVLLKTEGRSENLRDTALLKLASDPSPYIRFEAIQRIKGKMARVHHVSPVFKLLDRSAKEKLVHTILDTTASADRELTARAIVRLSQEGSFSREINRVLNRYRGSDEGMRAAEIAIELRNREAALPDLGRSGQ